MQRAVVATLLVVAACSQEAGSSPGAPARAPAADPCAKAKPEGAMPWIDDDYAAAQACAKAKKLPVVIDLWAPWCHTCLSMKSTVFTDPSFNKDGSRFVFASIDTERDANAPIVAKFPLSAWPTFYVVDANDTVLARFVGAASIAQFHAFLDAGARASSPSGADAHLLAAERAMATKDLATAEGELVAALAAAPKEWPRKADALVSLIRTKQKRKDFAGCLDVAEKSMDDTGNTASASDFIGYAMTCAESRDKDEAPRVAKLRERAVARWLALIDDPKAPLSVDDRSDAMASLRELYDTLGKAADAKAIAEAQRAMLDDAAAKAANPRAASTYNPHRAEVYAYLGRPLDLVPALEKSVRDLPDDYDPRIRLAWILMKGGKLDDAAKRADEALRLVYGPRKVRVLTIRAEIAGKQAGKAAEKPYRAEIVKVLESLPPAQAQPEALAQAKKTLADIDAPASKH